MDEVTLWKAPQPGRDAAQEIVNGFDPDHYPDDGPYFALDRALAEDWQDVYVNGLQEIHLPRDAFEELCHQGIIQPDGYYPGRSCHVPPGGLATFNDAILQGSSNIYYPQPAESPFNGE